MDRYDINRRAWIAWQCLPRDENGAPPKIRPLGDRYGITNNQLRKLIYGLSRRPSYEILKKIAAALETTPDFLQDGTGPAPTTRNFIPEWPGPKIPKKRETKTVSITPSAQAAFERDAKKLGKRG